MNGVTVGSLFSGAGGTALGFEWAGFEHKWFVEKEPYAQAVLRKRFPDAVIYGDITEVDFTTVQKIDVLEGGFPCQDISNAGKRDGITGSRSSLWGYFLEAIRILRPRIASVENVSALTDRGLDVVLADLASIGYDAEWHCFPASAVGAPHRRDRIFILAYPDGSGQLLGQAQVDADSRRQPSKPDARESGAEVADATCRGLEAEQRQNRFLREAQRTSAVAFRGWWASEPGMGRVANGVPNWAYRIKCLGNAVVPQAAQAVAEAIREVVYDGKY